MPHADTGMRARLADQSGYAVRPDRLRLYYEVFGSGPKTIVLMPCTPISHSRMWKAQIHYLARHFRVVAYDGLGNGLSDHPDPSDQWSPSTWANDCLTVMDETGTRSAILVGECSDGVWPAIQIAVSDPDRVLGEEVTAAAYQALPYHHPTIGWKSDIEHVPIAKLREFYDTFYWPNNATVTVIGDLEPAATLSLIKKYYGVYAHSPAPIPAIYTEEPAQSGERRVTVKRPGELGTVIIAHKVPNGRDADQPALEMLDAILSSGKNARLYRALVDQGLALNAGAGTDLHHDLSLHTVYAVLAPGATHAQAEKALTAEIAKIKTDGVTAAEVERVKQQFIAADAYKRDGTAAIAGEINEWIGVGDWTLYVTFPQKVQLVTPADVQRVAREYLKDDQSTTGWFIPVLPAAEKRS